VLSLNFFKLIRIAFGLLTLLGAGSWPVAQARVSVETETQQHADAGRRYFDKARYHDAISEYRKAYELKADPEFLFSIAGCYRQLGNRKRALFFYDRYLTTAPAGPNRVEAERFVATLGSRTLPPSASGLAEAGPPLPSLSNDVIIIPLAEDETPARRPLWKRWWVWTVVGAAVVAGTVAAFAARRREDQTVPTTDLGSMRY
jgi:tetratricopeptide (TPR) repeat protein